MNSKFSFIFFVALFCFSIEANDLYAEEKNNNTAKQNKFTVRVADPFLELHTGPGSNFPIYDVIERGEVITILRRKTDWYQVRGALNRIGWASREHMAETLEIAGIQKGTRETLLEDYLRDKFRFDISIGSFDEEASTTIRLAYRTNENIMLEFGISHISGVYSNSPLYQGNILLELYTDFDYRPFAFMGYSKFVNVPNSTTDLTAHSLDLLNAGFGMNYYLSERFVIRLEFSDHIVFKGNNRNNEFINYNLGFSIFF